MRIAGTAVSSTRRGKQRRSPDRLDERRALLTPEPKRACERARGAGMGDGLGWQGPLGEVRPRVAGPDGRHRVARDDRVRKGEGSSQQGDVVGIGFVEELGDDQSSRVGRAELAQARFVGDAFSGWEVGDRVRAAESFAHPLGGEKRGTDRGGTRPVRIRLGGDVPALRLTPRHERQHPVDVTSRRRVDVAVVHVRAGRACGAHELFGAVDERLAARARRCRESA